jgi:hypothetical protein
MVLITAVSAPNADPDHQQIDSRSGSSSTLAGLMEKNSNTKQVWRMLTSYRLLFATVTSQGKPKEEKNN